MSKLTQRKVINLWKKVNKAGFVFLQLADGLLFLQCFTTFSASQSPRKYILDCIYLINTVFRLHLFNKAVINDMQI